MLACCSSNAILTKIRAIFGQRLTDADYAQMARKKDVGEVAAYLKEHSSYRRTLEGVRETEVHRGQLEALLKKDTFYKYVSLLRYDFSGVDFYDYILVRLEIEEILRRISAIGSGRQDAYLIDLPGYLVQRTSFSLKELAAADTKEALLRCLQGTPYHKLLAGLLQKDAALNLLACEGALYRYYYQELLQSVDEAFSGQIRQQLRALLLCEIDARNVETVFRLRHIYKMPADAVRPLLLPWSGSLKREKLELLLRQEDAVLPAGLLRGLPEGQPPEDFIELQTHSWRYRFDQRSLRFSTDAPVCMYAFLALRDLEVENIITVIEGVRYQLPQEEVLSLLIQ